MRVEIDLITVLDVILLSCNLFSDIYCELFLRGIRFCTYGSLIYFSILVLEVKFKRFYLQLSLSRAIVDFGPFMMYFAVYIVVSSSEVE